MSSKHLKIADSVYQNIIKSAHQYAVDVDEGVITACKWVKLAVKRYFDDLKHGHERGLEFKPEKAAKAINFYKYVKHTKGGQFAGKPFFLSPWQAFIIWNVFGWYDKETGRRRFNYAYIKVARKNGKSTLTAPIGLYMLACEGEAVAEVYSVATKKDQAKIIFDEAKRIIGKNEKVFKDTYKRYQHKIVVDDGGTFEALGSDSDTMDGLNPYFVGIDEYHAHPNDGVFEVMKSGIGARMNPLIWIITTAGKSMTSPCFALEKDCKSILDGLVKDDSIFAMIYELDEEDMKVDEVLGKDGEIEHEYRWANSEIWIKSNPNLDVSTSTHYLKKELAGALRSSAKKNNFLTKNLNVWVDAPETWIDADVWRRNNDSFDEKLLIGAECYGGIDLAKRDDFCSFSLVFNIGDKKIIKCWSWIPNSTTEQRTSGGLHVLGDWIADGYVFETDGDITDYAIIKDFILEKAKLYDIKSIGFDPYNAVALVNQLTEQGVNMREFKQGLPMLVPTKEFYVTALNYGFNALNNPCLAWMVSKVVVRYDKNENMFIHKGESTKITGGKVDGVVATVIALGEMIDFEINTPVEFNIRSLDD